MILNVTNFLMTLKKVMGVLKFEIGETSGVKNNLKYVNFSINKLNLRSNRRYF